ncbi:type III polyketide synthase [Vibrio penaeicida]|uniref:type III polyketide synthase n=1 Tax=Vibrio penaeicida TaxID=104609 RepID=UPI000CEA6C3B|nr:type III polyketide synthase [Vibrio penaeicida]
MSVLSKPSVYFPEYVVTQDEIIECLRTLHSDQPHAEKAFDMVRNSSIDKRHLIVPLDKVVSLENFDERSAIYDEQARFMSEQAALQAIKNADLQIKDITMVIVTSCTGFMMPSLTAHLINALNLNNSTIQLPMAQMGCVAGAAAVNRAFDHCQQSPNNNALIVTLETSSLCFDKYANRIQDFVTNSLFGDACAAVVMRGDDQTNGMKLTHSASHFLQESEAFIRYDMTPRGFKFSLDKEVMYSIERVAPVIDQFVQSRQDKRSKDLDFYLFHTGGRRIQDEVERTLDLTSDALDHSRACLRETGNTSSAAVIDVLRRSFEHRKAGEQGVMAAFGPGFTTEMALGTWQ